MVSDNETTGMESTPESASKVEPRIEVQRKFINDDNSGLKEVIRVKVNSFDVFTLYRHDENRINVKMTMDINDSHFHGCINGYQIALDCIPTKHEFNKMWNPQWKKDSGIKYQNYQFYRDG